MELSFEVTIQSRENATWQGTLTAPDGARIPFRSGLELLRELDRRLPGPGAPPDAAHDEELE